MYVRHVEGLAGRRFRFADCASILSSSRPSWPQREKVRRQRTLEEENFMFSPYS